MEKKYIIYSYIFENKVYIGLTKNIEQRHKNRKNDLSDTVYKFCKSQGIEMPNPQILERSLTAIEAQSKEKNWIQYYESLGKEILNKMPCGIYISSLGGDSEIENENFYANETYEDLKKTKNRQRQIETTYEKCYNIALQYKFKNEFEKCHGYEYRFSKKMGWLKNFDWLENKKSKKNTIPLTYENYLIQVKKYKTKSEFAKGSKPFYLLGLKEGWNNSFFTKEVDVKVPLNYQNLSFNDIISKVKKYKTKTELNKKDHGLYECCRQQGWLKIIFDDIDKCHKEKEVRMKNKENSDNINIEELLSCEKYPSYYLDIKNNYIYKKLKKKIHKLVPRINRFGIPEYHINTSNTYTYIPYHVLVGVFLKKVFNLVIFKNNNFNDITINNLEFKEINIEEMLPFPQYPNLFINKEGFIYDNNLKIKYYGTKLTDEGWFYNGTDMGKLCYSLFISEIRDKHGYIQYINNNKNDYSVNNIVFTYTEINDILQLKESNNSTEFIINLNKSKLTLCHLSDKLTCNKLYNDLKDRIKENKYIEQWLYNFIDNILPLYIEENQKRNSLKKRTESSGCYWWEPRKKWKSKIFFNNKEYTLGYFDNFECGKYIYELAILSVKYNKFIEWYKDIKFYRNSIKKLY